MDYLKKTAAAAGAVQRIDAIRSHESYRRFTSGWWPELCLGAAGGGRRAAVMMDVAIPELRQDGLPSIVLLCTVVVLLCRDLLFTYTACVI